MKQTEKEYRIRVITTEEIHANINDRLKAFYEFIKNEMPNVLDVEYYVKSRLEDE
jgi:hypothetical protein